MTSLTDTIAGLERCRAVAEDAQAHAAVVRDDRNRSSIERRDALDAARHAEMAYKAALVAAAPGLMSAAKRVESLRMALAVDLGHANHDALYRHDLKALAADGGAASCHTDVGTAVATRLRVSANQAAVAAWVRSTLGDEVARNAHERCLRAAEEVIELAQACGQDAATIHRLVDYVFSRAVGQPAQEVAGSLVSLYAVAAALGVDAQAEFETELDRIRQPEIIERVRRRQSEKHQVLAATDPETKEER